MKATLEQHAIFESPAYVLKVSAFAGTGKTTTLQGYAFNHRRERILYVAFNKGIQKQAEAKFGNLARARTIHGIAFAHHGKDYAAIPNKLLSGDLKPFHVLKHLQPAMRVVPASAHNLYAARVLETVKNYLVSAELDMAEDHVNVGKSPMERRYFDPERILIDAKNIWSRMQSLRPGSVPITHDGYLKLFQCDQRDLPYDIILFDEAQDTNPVTQGIIDIQPSRKVYVGDQHQAIYGFRGARNAMAMIEADETLYLSGSFRFGPAIAEVANTLLSARGETLPLQGLGGESTLGFVNTQLPYAYLARSNSAIFARAIQALERREPFAFVGALYSYRFDLIEQAYRLYAGQKVSDPFLKSFASFTQFEEYGNLMKDREVMSRCRIVTKYTDRIPGLVRRISATALAYPHPAARVVLTTAHRAKGMEFEQVQMADDFMDFRQEDGSWKDLNALDLSGVEEINLQYVAVTRAQKCLQIGDRLNDYLFMHAAQAASKKVVALTASSDAIPSSQLEAPRVPVPAAVSTARRRFAPQGAI